MELIFFNISVKFFKPIALIRSWRSAAITTLVSMPKTAIDENNGLVFGKHNIRFAGQTFLVKAESITHPVKQ
jgi:hypothetical protein